MIELFTVTSKEGDPLLVKYNKEVSILPVWKNQADALAYITSIKKTEEYRVEEFKLDTYDSIVHWHREVNIKILLHLNI
jgi:hypothetical protein